MGSYFFMVFVVDCLVVNFVDRCDFSCGFSEEVLISYV